MSYRVIANGGYVSRPMSLKNARKYKMELRKLGNYNVEVMNNREVEVYMSRKNGVLM